VSARETLILLCEREIARKDQLSAGNNIVEANGANGSVTESITFK
jgi:hypothetical protein